VPEEADAVRSIFERYLALGSIGALIEDLDRRGIRTKQRRGNRQVMGGIRFGETHFGEHEPILDRDLFAAVQAKLVASAVARQLRLKGSPAILAGRIFDDRGKRMSPTHANKLGLRYRYYVFHAILQKRKAEAGSIARVPAPDIEKLVLDGVRKHLPSMGETEHPTAIDDRHLIERHVERVIVKSQALELRLAVTNEVPANTERPSINDPAARQLPTVITQVSGGRFPISALACRRPVRYLTETKAGLQETGSQAVC
jgi:site-specific DNA recombinase